MQKPNYFLISVSNRENLNLCERFCLAGFTNSINGVWTFSELNKGDFISFLYAARAHNLYEVIKKEAIENAENAGPWNPVTFKMSGKTYYFPFRLKLKLVRDFNEPLVRNEFAYVAENLLLRGGYRKTHFQADQTTLQNVSQLGTFSHREGEEFKHSHSVFEPKFLGKRKGMASPKIFLFQEIILQSLIKRYLSSSPNMKNFLEQIGVDEMNAESLEVLGEKALPEGHIDLLIKEAVPIGISRNIVIEVKTGKATERDFEQLAHYMNEFGAECLRGVIVARAIGKKLSSKFQNIVPLTYSLEGFGSEPKTFDELANLLKLEKEREK